MGQISMSVLDGLINGGPVQVGAGCGDTNGLWGGAAVARLSPECDANTASHPLFNLVLSRNL